MPIYEYQCLTCNQVFENLVFPGRIEKEKVICSKCGSSVIRLLPSMIGLAMHNTEMITPRDGYKVRNKIKREEKEDGRQNKEKS